MSRLAKWFLVPVLAISSALWAQSDSAMSVELSLENVRLWLQANAEPLNQKFNFPATAAEIAAFERQSEVTLPISVRAAYAVHDGEKPSSQGIFGTWRWLPLNEVKAILQQPREFGISLTADMIPILASGGGDYLYVESTTGKSAESEVIEWWHEQPTRNVRHATFAAMLQQFAESLRRGQYVYLPNELVGLIDKNEL